jgi:hypothetical protein
MKNEDKSKVKKEGADLRSRLEKIFSEGAPKNYKTSRIVSAAEWRKLVGDEGDSIYTTLSPVNTNLSVNIKRDH